MTDSGGRQAAARRQLAELVEQRGRPVMDDLGVDEGGLAALMDGGVELDEESLSKLERMGVGLGDGRVLTDEAPAKDSGPALGLKPDGEGKPEGVGAAGPGVGWSEEMERKRESLRSARALALITQFRLGMPYREYLAALGMVTQVELALISFFRESVPEPGVEWDGERRAREIERRLARLRWVEREQEREFGGLKGVWNRLAGRGKVSGKDLYQRMLNEADGMSRGPQGLEEVMRSSGVDGGG